MPSLFAAILKWGIYLEVVLRNNVKRKSTRASAKREIPHLSIAPYKEGVAIVKKQMPFRAILRSWTLLPSHKLLALPILWDGGPYTAINYGCRGRSGGTNFGGGPLTA